MTHKQIAPFLSLFIAFTLEASSTKPEMSHKAVAPFVSNRALAAQKSDRSKPVVTFNHTIKVRTIPSNAQQAAFEHLMAQREAKNELIATTIKIRALISKELEKATTPSHIERYASFMTDGTYGSEPLIMALKTHDLAALHSLVRSGANPYLRGLDNLSVMDLLDTDPLTQKFLDSQFTLMHRRRAVEAQLKVEAEPKDELCAVPSWFWGDEETM